MFALLGAADGNDAHDASGCPLCFGHAQMVSIGFRFVAPHGNDAHDASDCLLCFVPPSAMMLMMLPIVCVASMRAASIMLITC